MRPERIGIVMHSTRPFGYQSRRRASSPDATNGAMSDFGADPGAMRIEPEIPDIVIRRLPIYVRTLRASDRARASTSVSSDELADHDRRHRRPDPARPLLLRPLRQAGQGLRRAAPGRRDRPHPAGSTGSGTWRWPGSATWATRSSTTGLRARPRSGSPPSSTATPERIGQVVDG